MIVVLGSINADLVVRVSELARPGETVSGENLRMFPGGKGANQAVAAARAGAAVRMVGALGRDGFAEVAMKGLIGAGIDASGVHVTEKPTGVALIAVDRHGQNCITVAPGANDEVSAAWLEGALGRNDILALQLEIPGAAVVDGIRLAKSLGARSCLNAAPARELPVGAYPELDYLIVNETEAETIAHRHQLPADPRSFALSIRKKWGTRAIVTLGKKGALGVDCDKVVRVPAPTVRVVDTTAAGDSFVGAFLAALDRGGDMAEAMKMGVAAGSLACTKEGAQTSMPAAAEIQALAQSIAVAVD